MKKYDKRGLECIFDLHLSYFITNLDYYDHIFDEKGQTV
jgi:hypothetical protein